MATHANFAVREGPSIPSMRRTGHTSLTSVIVIKVLVTPALTTLGAASPDVLLSFAKTRVIMSRVCLPE